MLFSYGMKVNGRHIAAKIYEDLQNRVGELKKIRITPHLTVILIGKDPASIAYVNQKQKWGKHIGAKITIQHYPGSISNEELTKKIQQLNTDPDNHAILIQRPVPRQIDPQQLALLVNPQKDIDGFHPDSPYTLPLPLAVVKILEEIHMSLRGGRPEATDEAIPWGYSESHRIAALSASWRIARNNTFETWLKNQKIVILGKGPTGGNPVLKYLIKLGVHPIQIDSKTPSPDKFLKKADIIITAVGKPNIITTEKIKKDVILIGVGIFRGEDGKLHGDYNETDIKNIASFYTTTPGGVGPVNVAMLLQNLLDITSKQTNKK